MTYPLTINSISSYYCRTQLPPIEFHSSNEPSFRPVRENTTVCPPLLKSVKLANCMREFSATEIELALLLNALNGHSPRYAADSTGLSYMAGNSLAALASYRNYDSRMKPYYSKPERVVEAIGTRFDRTI
ncbi:hypothetical protein Pan54_01430 [Rubinisphaera italica]|uniref:Uncharacterized protein n=2 Tax=Rubinisphaera italica TaxID=2527969 RepID=A0A5C5X8G9_9PLAN|nr:hypothetical protein Pan54_01430 [Rubinisphaera italica]